MRADVRLARMASALAASKVSHSECKRCLSHGTAHCNLPSILSGGLRAGGGQAYRNEVGTGVYVSPYMQDAAAYVRPLSLSRSRSLARIASRGLTLLWRRRTR